MRAMSARLNNCVSERESAFSPRYSGRSFGLLLSECVHSAALLVLSDTVLCSHSLTPFLYSSAHARTRQKNNSP
jgi:hypothetical protein